MTEIGFSTPKNFNPVSWVVRKFTGSKVSHAFFVYQDEELEMRMVMEAHELGFRLTPYDHFVKKNQIIGLFTPTKPIEVGLRYVAKRYLGTVYDYPGLFGSVVVIAGRWLHRKWRNPFRSSRNVFCSEAVYIALQKSPGYECLTDDPDSVDPQLMMQYLEAGLGIKA